MTNVIDAYDTARKLGYRDGLGNGQRPLRYFCGEYLHYGAYYGDSYKLTVIPDLGPQPYRPSIGVSIINHIQARLSATNSSSRIFTYRYLPLYRC